MHSLHLSNVFISIVFLFISLIDFTIFIWFNNHIERLMVIVMGKANLVVGQSGGPTCVINSSLYGVIKEAIKNEKIDKVFGTLNGVNGLINNNLVTLNDLDNENLELLKQTPSAILGSVRYCLKNDFSHEDYPKILETFKKNNIKYFLYIGGNDSMDTVMKLSKYFKEVNYECYVLGVPKTIDNDLVVTDHTPGYGSAIKFIANSVAQVKEDTNCYKEGRMTIIEIMGRDAGWLTAGAKLASLNGSNPDLIYLPEEAFNLEDFLNKVSSIYQEKRKVLVCISEGIRDEKGEYILNVIGNSGDSDVFGHAQLGGVANALAIYTKEKLNIPTRGIELNLLQRCASNVSSDSDIKEASNCGRHAVKQVVKKQTGKMVVMVRENQESYKLRYELTDINKIANQIKYFPKEWIVNGCDISDEFIKYALPLINKEYKVKHVNGIVKFASIKSLIK